MVVGVELEFQLKQEQSQDISPTGFTSTSYKSIEEVVHLEIATVILLVSRSLEELLAISAAY